MLSAGRHLICVHLIRNGKASSALEKRKRLETDWTFLLLLPGRHFFCCFLTTTSLLAIVQNYRRTRRYRIHDDTCLVESWQTAHRAPPKRLVGTSHKKTTTTAAPYDGRAHCVAQIASERLPKSVRHRLLFPVAIAPGERSRPATHDATHTKASATGRSGSVPSSTGRCAV